MTQKYTLDWCSILRPSLLNVSLWASVPNSQILIHLLTHTCVPVRQGKKIGAEIFLLIKRIRNRFRFQETKTSHVLPPFFCTAWSPALQTASPGGGMQREWEKCVLSTQQFLSYPLASHTVPQLHHGLQSFRNLPAWHILTLSYPDFPQGATTLAAGPSHGLWWSHLGWLEWAVSSHSSQRPLQHLGTCTWYSQKYQNLQILQAEWTRKKSV